MFIHAEGMFDFKSQNQEKSVNLYKNMGWSIIGMDDNGEVWMKIKVFTTLVTVRVDSTGFVYDQRKVE